VDVLSTPSLTLTNYLKTPPNLIAFSSPGVGTYYFKENNINIILFFFIILLFICAYKAWVISPPCPHHLPYHPLRPLPLPPSIPNINYFALISNFVVERV
jgi:hypothetical protein